MLTTLSFGFSLSGKVTTEVGLGIPGVAINSFNYAGVSATSDESGAFSISNETDALAEFSKNRAPTISMQGNILNIVNESESEITVSLMDVLGKTTFQDRFHTQNAQINMKEFKNEMLILRVAVSGKNENYIITQKGDIKKALTKVGDQPAVIMFSKDGYNATTYTMTGDVETGVNVIMTVAGTTTASSASENQTSSSNVTTASSSSQIVYSSSKEEIVNCEGKTFAAGDHQMTVNVNGKNRTYIMHVPSAYTGDHAVPLVVDYHPIGGSGEGQLGGTTYKAITDAEGVISLYPDGTSGMSAMGAGWNVGPCCSYDDDVEFSRNMINQAKEKVCIDSKRIYATGFSMGGGMSNHVACNMADVYAAVAPAAMDLNTVNSASCNPDRPISVIMFRGTADFVCKYEGGDSGFNDGLNFLGAEKNFKFWADKDGCIGSPATNSDGCEEYSSCNAGTKVILCTKQGGGHEQGNGSIGWPFLKQFSLP